MQQLPQGFNSPEHLFDEALEENTYEVLLPVCKTKFQLSAIYGQTFVMTSHDVPGGHGLNVLGTTYTHTHTTEDSFDGTS